MIVLFNVQKSTQRVKRMKKQRNKSFVCVFQTKEQGKIQETDLNKPEISDLPHWVQNNGYKGTRQNQESNAWAPWELQYRERKYQKAQNREMTEVKNTITTLKISIEGFNNNLLRIFAYIQWDRPVIFCCYTIFV